MNEKRGYWRDTNDDPITAPEALGEWANQAYEALVEVAGHYHATITYGDLAQRVQDASGIRTSVRLHHWIGKVLGKVVYEAHRRGDPPLTALVVRGTDGKVGDGYNLVLEVTGGPPVEDDLARERHAAGARLACYQHYCTTMPEDGGFPALAPKLQVTVDRERSRAEPVQWPMCRNCFVQVPATGICDTCGDRPPADRPLAAKL